MPPFASEPKALVAAAEKIDDGGEGMVDLLDEMSYTFDAEGRMTRTERLVYRIVEEAAIEYNGEVSAEWAPWYDERPVIAARVVTKNGTVHTLDEKAISEAAGEADDDIFSDSRVLRAPLPAVEVGAVVEYVITTKGKSPIPGAGTSGLFAFGRWVPVHRSRLVIAGPASIEPRIVNKADLKPVVEEKDGLRRITFETGRLEPWDEKMEGYVPFDDADYKYIAFSTGPSWQHIASQYAQLVDKQIADSELQKLVKSTIGNATDRREIVARLLAAIQKDIRYAGVEIAEGSIIPRTPAAVLKNKYGDCKDKATLLVAMLRAAGIPAHVVLIRAGMDLDVHADLPGLGRFNHAIVRVDGDTPIWVDPTDEYARAGELPSQDQGRMVLIASAETTALTRTPELPSSVNRSTETRLYTLPEEGKSRVVEITETAGVNDASARRWASGSDAKSYREAKEDYVKSFYHAKSLGKLEVADAHDLTKPFRLSVEAIDAKSGLAVDGDASVGFHPSDLLSGLPGQLYDWEEPKPDDDPKDAPKKRVHDFILPTPHVKELVYRITPAAGYTVRPLPKSETRKLGVATVTTEYRTEADGSAYAKLSLEIGKRRLAAAEYEETRVALSKFQNEPAIYIGFDLAGQAKLAAGDITGALAEFRKLAGLHPKEAQHHLEIARALLAGGLGEAARDAARRAVAMEPKNAHAHAVLADVLEQDLLGRPFRKGSDIAGAIAERRKAKELDPAELQHRIVLARLLTYGDDGVRFTGRNVRLTEAIEEFRAMAKDFGDDARKYDGELMLVLAHAGQYKEVKELAATTTNAGLRDEGYVMAAAVLEGIPAAQQLLASHAPDSRRAYAADLGKHFMALRKYPEAATMMETATQGSPKASESATFIEVLRKTRRIEDLPAAEDDPRSLIPRLLAFAARDDREGLLTLFPRDMHAELREEMKKEDGQDITAAMSNAGVGESVSPAVMLDLMQSMFQFQKEGGDETGYRVRMRVPMVPDMKAAVYSVREDGRHLIRALSENETIGQAALHFLEQNQPERARIWLNWAREDVELGGGDDPLKGSPFATVWPKAKAAATADEIRLAATLQMTERDEKYAPKLEPLRANASEAAKAAIDRGLAGAYIKSREWQKLLEPAQRLYAQQPDSETAFAAFTSALSFTGKTAEAESLAKQRLERLPRDRAALRALSQNASAARDYHSADTYAQQLLGETSPERDDYDHAAWYGVLAGNLERALENARLATSSEGKNDKETAPAFRTLALVYAESGKTLEARQALLSSIDQRNSDQPNSDDWYVLGRIAETYGVRDAAVAAYKRVTATGNMQELAARRLKGLQ
ncbi:MAG TPA: DUF3857 domain-containing protein [Thermoanaerobaculia bacterium]|nr:DUF3857 domain-containing protein [Thermoanaerobaculia bacterium]